MPDYDRLERLGAGNFGEVWLVYDRALDVRRAVKYVRPDRIHDPTDFYSEPRTLMDLEHDHIVSVCDAGTKSDGTLYISMEYHSQGSIENRFKGRPLDLTLARKYLCGVCWGLEYAHQRGYVHRDIKPANILISNSNRSLLSDFGLAAQVPRGQTASPYGYLTHLSPEAIRGEAANPQTDIYALGVTAYRLVNGDAFLPDVSDFDELQDLILEGKYPDRSHYRPYVPAQMKRVINAAMDPDPARRLSSAPVLRKKLEAIQIQCDWKWKRRRNTVVYSTKLGNFQYLVSVSKLDSGRFNVDTQKVNGKKVARRVRADCHDNLTKAKMKPLLRKILARYVTNGK